MPQVYYIARNPVQRAALDVVDADPTIDIESAIDIVNSVAYMVEHDMALIPTEQRIARQLRRYETEMFPGRRRG